MWVLLQLEHAFEKQSAKDGKPIQNHKIGSQSSTNTIWVKAKNKSINKSIKWRCVTCHNTWKVSTFTMNVYIYFLYIFPFRDCQHRQHLLYDEHLGNVRGKGLEGHSTFCISVCFLFSCLSFYILFDMVSLGTSINPIKSVMAFSFSCRPREWTRGSKV